MSKAAEPSHDPPLELSAPGQAEGIRLDVWLHETMPALSRARIQGLIRDGMITINGARTVPRKSLHAGMTVCVRIPPTVPVETVAQDIPLSILHEDSDIIVVDKPPGLVVHPAAGHADGTLVNALLYHCRDLAGVGGERRPGIVHRLDKDTSGAMVVAKHDAAMDALVRQFSNREVRKEYLALVRGIPLPAEGSVETLVGRSRHDRKKMSARPATGRTAVTHYCLIEALEGAGLLRVTIETGRTHQIRVHMAHLGHAILGDTQYGSRSMNPAGGITPPRQMLHAALLGLKHPRTNRRMKFRAPIPADMQQAIEALRKP